MIITLTGIELEVKLRPLVHPHRGDSGEVAVQDIAHAARKGVGGRLSKEMPDVGARGDLDTAAALPGAKRQFQIFAAPNSHLIVVAAQFEEILSVY